MVANNKNDLLKRERMIAVFDYLFVLPMHTCKLTVVAY